MKSLCKLRKKVNKLRNRLVEEKNKNIIMKICNGNLSAFGVLWRKKVSFRFIFHLLNKKSRLR